MGICTADSIINLALCCLGYVPGLLHAWYIILKNPEPDYDDLNYEPVPGSAESGRDVENGRVAYYYVAHQPLQNPSPRTYGTLGSQPAPAANTTSAPKQHGYEEGPGEGAEGSSQGRAPPTYAEAVKGDNKVQTQE